MELEGILSEEERASGFTLEEEEDFVFLLRYGWTLAVFSSHGVTREKLSEFVDREKGWSPGYP